MGLKGDVDVFQEADAHIIYSLRDNSYHDAEKSVSDECWARCRRRALNVKTSSVCGGGFGTAVASDSVPE